MYIPNTDLSIYELIEIFIGLFYFIIYILTVIAFLKWFRRAYYNLHTYFVSLDFTEGWAVGGWFIPILNLFRPYKIMCKPYSRTSKEIRKEEANFTFINLWWFFWVITNMVSNASNKIYMRANTVEQYLDCYYIDIFLSLVLIPLAFLALKVVSGYSKMEQQFRLLVQVNKIGEPEEVDLHGEENLEY